MQTRIKKLSLFLLFIGFFLIGNELFSAVENAKDPCIYTKGDSQYVYDIWTKNDSTNDIIQFANSSNYGASWNTPIDLSDAGQNAKTPTLYSDSTAAKVNAIWVRSNGTNDIVQYSNSSDYGQNWIATQNLSTSGQNAFDPDLVNNSSSSDVYAIWARSNGTNDIIQFSKSVDSGATFSSPVELSDVGQNAKTPRIETNINDNCVCAIWARSNGTNDIIQFKHSSDYGENWDSTIDLSDISYDAIDPRIDINGNYIYAMWTSQIDGIYITEFRKSDDNGSSFADAQDLSHGLFSANNPKIVSSNDGQYIYITWYMSNGKYTDAHVVISKDYGGMFDGPYALNKYGKNCLNTDIATDINGQNTYVVWTRSNGTNDIVQLGKSNDYGVSWTTYGMDLSLTGQNAKNPTVSTDQTGQKVYVTWARFDGTKDVVQQVYSSDYGATFSVPQVISN